MRPRGTGTLGAAQGLALLAALGSAGVYAAWLDAHQLAVWALALGAGRAAMLLVDGGFKTALVRHPQRLSFRAEARLTRRVSAFALALAMLAIAASAAVVDAGWAQACDAALVAVSMVCYLLSHALSLVALARLERSGLFDRVGRAEGAATVLEFVLPAVLMAAGAGATWALMAGVVAGRAGRATWLVLAAVAERSSLDAQTGSVADALPWRDGLTLQGIAALAMLRDQIHLWLVGPWFGAAWAGAYAFGLMACALASQVLVATVARVAMPALRPLSPVRRAVRAAHALRRLALVTVPLLAATVPLMMAADTWLWDGRWQLALTLLPGLVLRMLAGLPLTVLAPWLLVAVTPRAAAKVHGQWTLAEVLLAVVALSLFGPVGLAVSWAAGGLLGTLWFAAALRPHGLAWFVRALVRVPVVHARLQPTPLRP
jgi:O-antigen/teichoic acid export membrane protein